MQENLVTAQPWAGREPRRWQAESLPLVLASVKARERGVVSAIMGSGKSILIAEVCASGRGRVLVTVPTIALVEQIAATLEARCPDQIGTYYTAAKQASRRITVCCLPSVLALVADPQWPGPPQLWIADEAHKTEAKQILAAYAAMAPERALGFTATPFRADEGQALSLWDREIYVYGVAAALRDGVIVPFRAVQWQGRDDVGLDDACVSMIRKAIDATGGAPGMANATSIDDAVDFAGVLSAAGIPAAAVHSRLPRPVVASTIDALREGRLATIVHVNMLSEGIDMPWLHWLCMRRPVGSRVRFCQEIGRVLRAYIGKREAILLDPHDLLGSFALAYEAILSGGAVDEKPLARELRDATEAGAGLPGKEPPSPKVLTAWRRYLRAIYLSAMGAGLIDCRVKSTRWRPFPPSPKQIAAARKMGGILASSKSVPPEHGLMLGTLVDHAAALTRGDCSDLLSLAFAALDARKTGRDFWPAIVSPPES